MNDDEWHKLVLQILEEMGGNFEYQEYRKRMLELHNVLRMKKFLKLEERWANKGGVKHDDVE